MKKILLFLFLSFALSFSTFAQVSSTVSGIDTRATIIAPLSIELTDGTKLNFGTITKNASENIVTVTPGNDRTASVANTLLISGPSSVPSFTIVGESDVNYTLTLPANGVVTLTGTGEPMPVSNFTSNIGVSGTKILTGGTQALTVGATLTVAPAQVAGLYTGTFNVTVAYN